MATGFLVVGPKVIGATDKEQLLIDVIDEQLDTIGKAFLGLTIGCARCHDHKFDPISARDYYALAGILASTETIHGNLLNRRDLTGWNLHPLGSGGQAAYEAFLAHEKTLDGLVKEQKELQAKQEALKKGMKPADGEKAGEAKPEANVDPKAELQRIEERLAELKQEISEQKENPAPRPPLAMSVNDHEHPGPMEICIRGDAHNRGETVPRGFLSIVDAPPAGDRAGCQRPGAAGRVAHRRPESAHRPRGGEPGLAAPVRAGAGRHAGRLRHAGRASLEPGAARPPGPAVHAAGLVGEATDPPAWCSAGPIS